MGFEYDQNKNRREGTRPREEGVFLILTRHRCLDAGVKAVILTSAIVLL